MNVTTNQFLESIGKGGKVKDFQEEEEEIEEILVSKKEESLNKSLGQICEALDTSFLSKRTKKRIRRNKLIKC